MLSKTVLIFLFFSNFLLITSTKHVWYDKKDAFLQTNDLITKYGYIAEDHSVVTEDGYMLTLNRLINKNHLNKTRPAVLIYHGLCGYGGVFLINGNSSLGFYLSDNGYDVWLANVRGTRYSSQHKTLDNESSKYWDFSWHEMGVKDVPVSIDYIINKTGQKKINIIAHSQGVTLFIAFMAELPEYNEKIKVAHILGPTLSLKYNKNAILKISSKFSKLIQVALNLIGMFFVPFQVFITPRYIKEVCPPDDFRVNTCDTLLRLGLGWVSKDQTEIVVSHSSNAPIKSGVHYLQLIESGKFQKFDYGTSKNLILYGQSTPPPYNTSTIKIPIYVHYGDKDIFNEVEDIEKVNFKLLPNIVGINKIPGYGHYDFIGNEHVNEMVYVKILENFNKYN